MSLSGSHVPGDTGHVADHNAIDTQINTTLPALMDAKVATAKGTLLTQAAAATTYQGIVPASYYVDPSAGSDSNSGLSWAKAFQTLNAAVTALSTAAGTIYLKPRTSHAITSAISIDVSKQNIVGVGSIIDTTALGAGTSAVTLTSTAASSYVQRKNSPILPGIELNGGSSKAGTNKGLVLAGTSTSAEVAHLTIGPVVIHGYGTGISLGSHTHSLRIDGDTYNCGTGIIDSAATTNAGERIVYHGSIFNNDVGVNLTNSAADYVFQASFDYNPQQLVIAGPAVTLLGCHIEGNDATYAANYPIAMTSGSFCMFGGMITGAATAITAFINNTSTGPATFDGVAIFNNRWFSTSFAAGTGITRVMGFGGSLAGITAPTFPATGVSLRNPYPVDVTVYQAGGSMFGISIDGVGIGNNPTFRLAAGASVLFSYTGSPTWVWVGINY